MFKLAVSIQETQVVCKSHLSISLCLEYLVKISPGEGEGGRAARHPSQVFYFVITEERSQAADSALPPATPEQY